MPSGRRFWYQAFVADAPSAPELPWPTMRGLQRFLGWSGRRAARESYLATGARVLSGLQELEQAVQAAVQCRRVSCAELADGKSKRLHRLPD